MRRSVAVLIILIAWVGQAAAASQALPDHAAVQAALGGSGTLALGGRVLDRAVLEALYEKRNFEPIWNERRAESWLRALDEAASHGLDSQTFSVPAVARATERELLLTDAFLRYAATLARGRVSPGTFEADWRIASPAFDASKVLDAAVAGDVAIVLAELAPQDPAYARLRAALERYREFAKSGWRPVPTKTPLRLGDSGESVRQLRERLAAEGFITPAEPDDAATYDQALADAVSRFQTTHGLTVDGTAGRLTLAALNVAPALRVKQIRANLERWRSLPRINAATRIEVNVAAATAILYQDDQPAKTMRVIVGAVAHPTPVLRARMVSVLFNPPWNVPSSIIENEIRPALKRDPRYLQRHGYAYWEVNGGRQLVQVPGPKNSLGQIKFEMPNPDDIYMHDTPEQRLFAAARRAFSHGCVRVEDPRDLARLVLDSADWPPAAIDAAIAAKATRNVLLPRKIPVYMLYWTAFVDPDGTVEFRDDIYGRDKRLADMLAAQDAAEHLAITASNADRS